ncbi:MAG: dihydrofolate reductase family protein [Methyloceanibacter sp.]
MRGWRTSAQCRPVARSWRGDRSSSARRHGHDRSGITRVLIEGGPAVAESFVAADLVDEAVIYQSPNPVGDGGLMPFGGEGLDRLAKNGHFALIATRAFGPDRMTRWRRIRSCSLALSAA